MKNRNNIAVILGLIVPLNLYALEGEKIYQQTCIVCHGEDGAGVLPGVPDFAETDGRLKKSDAELIISIRDGMQSEGSPMAMPAKGGNNNLSETEMQQVLQYIRKKF